MILDWKPPISIVVTAMDICDYLKGIIQYPKKEWERGICCIDIFLKVTWEVIGIATALSTTNVDNGKVELYNQSRKLGGLK